MNITGTLVNYYFHCKRQCYLSYNRLNLEENSDEVLIGKVMHEEKFKNSIYSEIAIDNVKIDKITDEYLIEYKKSDSDIEAAKWQLIYYLYKLNKLGIIRKGKLQFEEAKQIKTEYFELDDNLKKQMEDILKQIEDFLNKNIIPSITDKKKCKKCAFFPYCNI